MKNQHAPQHSRGKNYPEPVFGLTQPKDHEINVVLFPYQLCNPQKFKGKPWAEQVRCFIMLYITENRTTQLHGDEYKPWLSSSIHDSYQLQ